MKDTKGYRTPIIGRIADVLSYLGHQEATLPVMVRDLKLPKTSLYVLLLSLLDVGFVRLLPDGHTYALGFKLYELGTLAVGRINLRELAQPFLENLRDKVNLTCHMGCLDGNEAFYLVKLNPLANSVQVKSWEGKRISLYSSGVGKALLAWQPAEAIRKMVASFSMKPITPTTITDPDELINHLADIRRQQWSFDDEEDCTGLRCVATPVFSMNGEVTAAISVSGPLHQVNDETIDDLVREVKATARAITAALGSPYPDPE